MATTITEELVSIDPKSLEEEIKKCKTLNKGLCSFNLVLTVVKPNNKSKYQKNVFLNLDSHSSRKLAEIAYDNFLDCVRYAYEKFAAPFYVNVCKAGDIVRISAEIDEEGFFIEDKCSVSIIISIPNESKANWASYIDIRYRELVKFHPFMTAIDFDVRDYKIQKVTFNYDLKLVAEQTFKSIANTRVVEDEAIGYWYALAEEVEKKNKKENQHTHRIHTERELTEFGNRLTIKGLESHKCRIE